MRVTVGIKTGAAFGVCVSILLLSGALSYRSATRVVGLTGWVVHTHDVLEMPRMDGFGLLEAVKADAGLRGIPVILMTSREEDASRRRGLELGAGAFINQTQVRSAGAIARDPGALMNQELL